jgi:chromosome segregation ATPase
MKNFHQKLFIVLALCLCGLCAYQWYGQTVQRNTIQNLNDIIYANSEAIQGYTNDIKNMQGQITQMDAHLTEVRATIKTNEQTILDQKREQNKLDAQIRALNGEVDQYKSAVASLEAKLKDAYDGIEKRNDSIKQLVAERDGFVQKLNDTMTERNNIVKKYNDLVTQVEKLQGGSKSQ